MFAPRSSTDAVDSVSSLVRRTLACVTVALISACLAAGWGPSAASARGATHHCHPPRGYDSVKVRHVSCHRARKVLKHNGKRSHGFRCRYVSRAPGGQGFPVDRVCTKGRKRIVARVRDSAP